MNTNKINYYSTIFSGILFFFIPAALITGPFIPDLFLVIICLNLIFLSAYEKNFEIFKNKFFILFLIFCIVASLTSIMSENLSSLKSSSLYFRFGLFTIASYLIIKNNKLLLKYLFYFFLIIYFILFVDTLFQYFFSKNLLGFTYENLNNFRITSFFGEDEVLGSYTARFFPLLMFLFIYNSKFNSHIKKLPLILFIISTSFTIILFSGERTSIALFFICLIFIILSSQYLRKIMVIPIVSVLLISIISFSFSDKIKTRVITTTINQLGLNPESERLVLFSKTYEGHYKIASNMFLEKPILGHGAKMFRFYCSKKENFVSPTACSTHPHNFYAQMLGELGLFGFISIFLIFFIVLVFFMKNLYAQIIKKKQLVSDEAICLLACCFINLFPLLPSGNFFNNWLSIIIYYPVGFLIFIIKEKKFYV